MVPGPHLNLRSLLHAEGGVFRKNVSMEGDRAATDFTLPPRTTSRSENLESYKSVWSLSSTHVSLISLTALTVEYSW
jgi:hypothetical protein